MAKKLADRYRTAEAVLKDLKRVVEEQDNEHPLRGEAAMPTVEVGSQPLAALHPCRNRSIARRVARHVRCGNN